MATNIYRYEELVYFGPEPERFRGYWMSTTSDSTRETVPYDAWSVMESRAEKLFPGCDPVRMAGFALIASQSKDFGFEAQECLADEVLACTGKEPEDVWEDVIEVLMYEPQSTGEGDK